MYYIILTYTLTSSRLIQFRRLLKDARILIKSRIKFLATNLWSIAMMKRTINKMRGELRHYPMSCALPHQQALQLNISKYTKRGATTGTNAY